MKKWMKEEIKANAVRIKEFKKLIKETQKAQQHAGKEQMELHWLKVRTRHLLLAYGTIRGKTIEQMEALPKCQDNRTHDEKLVKSIINEFMEKEKASV